MKLKQIMIMTAIFIAIIMAVGCGDSSGTDNPPSVIKVIVTPSTVRPTIGTKIENGQLTASVTALNGAPKAVIWSVFDAGETGSGNVTVTPDGMLNVVDSALEGEAVIRATSTYDSSKYGECRVSIRPAPSPSSTDFVWIPAGTFTMGSPDTESGRNLDETQHGVMLSKGFYMGKYPVTQAQWEYVMEMTIGEQQFLAEGFDDYDFGRGPKYPMYFVSWYDALVFCNKLSLKEGLSPAYSIGGSTDPDDWGTVPYPPPNPPEINAAWDAVQIVSDSNGYRLPTEAQWEYACRAGTTTAYNNTGDTFNDNTGWFSKGETSYVRKVGLKLANDWELYDMHGNVAEWCWDLYGDYASGSQTDPTGATSWYWGWPSRVLRGGSDASRSENYLRSACRDAQLPWLRPSQYSASKWSGFRIVRPE